MNDDVEGVERNYIEIVRERYFLHIEELETIG